MSRPGLKAEPERLLLSVRLTPRASKNEVKGWKEGALVVRLTAPPVEGKANAALIKFIAKRLGLAPSGLRLVSGQTSRLKVIEIRGIGQDEALNLLG